MLAFSVRPDLEGVSGGSCDIGDIPVNREYLIYAIAGIDFTEDDVTRLFGTLQAAEAFTVSKSFLEQSNSIPLAFVPQGSIFVEDGGCYEIPLRRLLAKYNFTIDASAMTGRFTATSLTVRQSPLFTRPLVMPNSATSPAALCDGDAATPDEVALLNESGKAIGECALTPAALRSLVVMAAKGTINGPTLKELLPEVFEKGGDPEAIVKERGLGAVSDTAALEAFVDQAIAANPGPVADFKAGKKAAAGFFVGQVMKLSKGKADPKIVGQLVARKLAAL